MTVAVAIHGFMSRSRIGCRICSQVIIKINNNPRRRGRGGWLSGVE